MFIIITTYVYYYYYIYRDIIQSEIDHSIRSLFESILLIHSDEPLHPSGQPMHPNSAWSLNQPNTAPARGMHYTPIHVYHIMYIHI